MALARLRQAKHEERESIRGVTLHAVVLWRPLLSLVSNSFRSSDGNSWIPVELAAACSFILGISFGSLAEMSQPYFDYLRSPICSEVPAGEGSGDPSNRCGCGTVSKTLCTLLALITSLATYGMPPRSSWPKPTGDP